MSGLKIRYRLEGKCHSCGEKLLRIIEDSAHQSWYCQRCEQAFDDKEIVEVQMDGVQKEETGYKPRHFSRKEVKELSPDLVALLDMIREECGWPLVINSGYREGDPLSHGAREAVDLKLWEYDSPIWRAYGVPGLSKGAQRQKLHDVARKNGICRIGLYDRHIHLDISKALPQNVTWVGVSK